MDFRPRCVESNTRSRPSGDHRAVRVRPPLNDVTCAALPPSESLTQTSHQPERSEMNAIRSPSGEYCGQLFIEDDAIRRCGLPSLPSTIAARQIFSLVRTPVKNRRETTGESKGALTRPAPPRQNSGDPTGE